MKIEIIDTTLRDGEQAPGIHFTNNQRRKIAFDLMELGIDEIEAGIPVMGRESRDFISSITNLTKDTFISAWSRLRLSDIKAAEKTGVDIIHISIPMSYYHIPESHKWVENISELIKIIKYASDNFGRISIGLQDSFRTPSERLDEICSIAEFYKLYRIRFSDTVGNSLPSDIESIISKYRSSFSGKLDFHGHNDLGLASANSLKAIESGADSVNVTINGIGERAGNTALEQIAFILDKSDNYRTNLKLNRIKNICERTAEFTNRKPAMDRPIVGRNVFVHESGIHTDGQSKNPLAYQPFIPEAVGLSKSNLVIGSHSGRTGLETILKNAGIICNRNSLNPLLNRLKKLSESKGDYLTSKEVVEIYKSIKRGKYGRV